MTSSQKCFSDYVVYVDESGDHGLASMDSTYPVFVLAFCVFEKSKYIHQITPQLQEFKFRYFGHDMVVLHEHEIRKPKGPFTILFDADVRERFMVICRESSQTLRSRFPDHRNVHQEG